MRLAGGVNTAGVSLPSELDVRVSASKSNGLGASSTISPIFFISFHSLSTDAVVSGEAIAVSMIKGGVRTEALAVISVQ